MEFANPHFLFLDCILNRFGDGISRLAPRKLGDDERLAFLLDLRTDLHLAESVLVLGDVHDASELEIGKYLERLLLQDSDLGLKELDEVVRQNRSREADRDAVRAEHEEERDLRWKKDWFLLASVIVRHIRRSLAVEDLLARKFCETTFDVTRRGMRHAS